MNVRLIRQLLLLLLCLHLLPAARGQQIGWQTARGFGGVDQQFGQPNYLHATAPDAIGNVYVVGAFVGTTDFGNFTTFISAGAHDAFVAKYDGAGQLQWVRTLSGPSDESFMGVCINSAGGCYVTGEFGPQATIDGINTLSGSGIITAAYDDDGLLTWSDVTTQNGSGTGSATAVGVASDEQGRCYVTGIIASLTRTFGALTVAFPATAETNAMPFVCCYKPNRQMQWVKATTITRTESYPFGIVGTDNGCIVTARYSGSAANILGVATDSTRNAYLAPYYDFDGLAIALDSLGTPLWKSQIKNPFRQIYLTPPIVSGGRVLLAGSADTTFTFSQSSFSVVGQGRFAKTFVAAYDLITGVVSQVSTLAQGVVAPSRPTGAGAVPLVLREYPDGLYIGGYFGGVMQFGAAATLTNNTEFLYDGFVAKYDPAGSTCEWVVPASTLPASVTSARTTVKGISVAPSGEVLAAGEFFQQASFGATTLTAIGSGSLFLGRIGRVVGLPDSPRAEPAVDVWPNPAHEQVWVRVPSHSAGPVAVTLLDAVGRVVRRLTLESGAGQLDCRGLPGGVYTVRFSADGLSATRRLVVAP